MEGKPKVVITGVSGFLGSWVLKTFVDSGDFSVRGTVRDPTNKKKMQPLEDALGSKFKDVEFVAADLNNAESLEKAIEGCEYVVHTASPFPPGNPKSDDEIIKPAVEGTKTVAQACHKFGVKRLVVTSSCASIYDYNNFKEKVDENDWVDMSEKTLAYPRSKALAEKAVWDYLDTLKESERFEFVSINPTLIFGPILVKSPFATQTIMSGILMGKDPGVPDAMIGFVDVREVATAHYLALTKSPPNERYILAQDNYKFTKIGEVLDKEFRQYGYKPTKKELPYCMVKTIYCCCCWKRKELAPVMLQWGKYIKADNTKSKTKLGVKYRPIEETIVEMGYSCIENGYVPDKRKKE
jgi:nucleoside-diphosphate-sugar epimerase